MRYTIQKENEVKQMAADGCSLEYIAAKTSLPKKVIWGWCPELRPHDDIIKQSVKQRYHFIFPDYEAKITTSFSPYVTEDISDDDWEALNDVVYDTMFDLAVYVFRNAITDLPEFSDVKKLCDVPFLKYCRNFWDFDNSEYIKEANKDKQIISKSYADSCYNAIHHWSFLKNKKVKDITKGDLQIMQENLVAKDLSPSRVYFILRAGVAPLRYAYDKGLTLTNANEFKMPKKTKKKNNYIPNTLVQKLFEKKWDNEEAYFANLIAYYGHLKLNEVNAIMVSDLSKDGVVSVYSIYNGNYQDLEANPHPKEIKLPTVVAVALYNYIENSERIKYREDFLFDSGTKRNVWNDELKKQAAKYTDLEVNFSMWAN